MLMVHYRCPSSLYVTNVYLFRFLRCAHSIPCEPPVLFKLFSLIYTFNVSPSPGQRGFVVFTNIRHLISDCAI